MPKFGVIGVGNMATAILNGMLKKKVVAPQDVLLCDRHPEAHASFYEQGVQQAADACTVARHCDYVLLSVKPQGFAAVLQEIRPGCRPETVFISIAAGISADAIKQALGFDAKIVLAMPNTPVSLGFGTTAVAPVAPVDSASFAQVLSFFAACGEAVEIAPDKMNEVIPLNGSSPAFLYRIAQVFVQRGVEMGFTREAALRLFAGTMIGAAHMMTDSGIELDQLIQMVCSKGGTTIAGLEAMERGGLADALTAGIDDCVKRAYELGK